MPAITISKRNVDQAKPGDRDLFFWDKALAGLGLKVTPAGAKIYLCQYRTGGRGSPTKRVTIGRHGAPWTPDQAPEGQGDPWRRGGGKGPCRRKAGKAGG